MEEIKREKDCELIVCELNVFEALELLCHRSCRWSVCLHYSLIDILKFNRAAPYYLSCM